MSKVLTVSYGTFSCTLEGFDDSFSTMKAIAEYFRDLAADDRYFGAEPATPDAEMLARIAEREVSHRVEAKMQDGGVVLRPSANVAKIAAAAAAAAPAQEAEVAPEPEAEPEAEAAPEPQVEDTPAPEMEAEATPEMAEPVEFPSAEPGAPAVAAEAPLLDDESSVAAKLRRIRAVVQKADADEATALYSEDEHAAPYYQESEESTFAEPEVEEAEEELGDFNAAEEPAVADEDVTSKMISGLVSEVDEAETADEVAEEIEAATEEGTAAEETAAEETEAEAEAEAEETEAEAEETAVEFEAEAEEFEDEPEMAMSEDEADLAEEESEEVQAAAEVEAEDEDESEADADTEDAAEFEDDENALEAEDQIAAAADTDETEDDDDDVPEEAGYAASADDEFEESYETAPIAEDLEIAATGQDDYEDEEEAVDFADAATAEDDADDSALSPEAEAELAAELADLEKVAETEFAEEAGEDAPPRERKTYLEDGIGDDDAAVSRILDHTNSEMESSEGSRRRSAIAHLKAAVAATRADGKDRPSKEAESAAEAAPYREDLADVVQPRRPLSRGRGERPRPTPLMLVSEQRIDLPKNGGQTAPAAIIQPRRVTKGSLAMQVDENAETGEVSPEENVENLFSEKNFESFATEMGATELPDLLEAAAAYVCLVEGRPHFSRPQVMRRAKSVAVVGDFSREDGLRSFGQLLRQGKINKKNRGEFTIAESTRFKPVERHTTH